MLVSEKQRLQLVNRVLTNASEFTPQQGIGTTSNGKGSPAGLPSR